MAQELRTISKRCTNCREPLSVLVKTGGELVLRDGDAVGVCTNIGCMRHGDEVEVDPQKAS